MSDNFCNYSGKRDETIVEISTDKVDVELPSPATGRLAETLVDEGDTVTVGQVIARIAVERTSGDGRPAPATPAAEPSSSSAAGPGAPPGVKVSPVAARAAAAEGVELGALAGSGPAGRITKSDVLAAATRETVGDGRGAEGAGAPTAEASREGAEPLKGGAAALARYMSQSLSIPTATSLRTLAVTVLDARRR